MPAGDIVFFTVQDANNAAVYRNVPLLDLGTSDADAITNYSALTGVMYVDSATGDIVPVDDVNGLPVVIVGTVATGGLTDTELRATPVLIQILEDTSGTTADSSGNGRTGTLVGTILPSLIVSPFTGGGPGAFHFDSTSTPVTSAVDLGVTGFGVATASGSCSITAKVRRDRSGVGVTEAIASKWGTGTANENWLLQISGDKLAFSMVNGSSSIISAVGTTSLAVGALYDVEGEWTGTVLRVKVNGVQEGTTQALTTLLTPNETTRVLIGKIDSASSFPFDGAIDEVEIVVGGATQGLYHLDDAGTAINIGQRSMSESISVTMASDQTRVPVRDNFTAIEHEADQTGAGAVLTFTLAAVGDFIMVDVDNTDVDDTVTYRARATLDGSTPTATLGFVCRSGQTTYLPFPMTGVDVKVFAPTGVVVAVQAGRYAA